MYRSKWRTGSFGGRQSQISLGCQFNQTFIQSGIYFYFVLPVHINSQSQLIIPGCINLLHILNLLAHLLHFGLDPDHQRRNLDII